MRVAVVADVHANLAALQACMREIEKQSPERILCLGDVVGYSAEPAECIDIVRERCSVVLAGNHDVDVATGRRTTGTNELARAAVEWTRNTLDDSRMQWLASLRPRHTEDGVLMALHGSFLGGDPTLGYVTSTMLEENLAAIATAGVAPLALCGHSHVPLMGWTVRGDCEEAIIRAGEPISWPADATAVLINPGSVGQSRDRDARAAFAMIDTGLRTATWHRVEYDIEQTVRAIRAAGLPSDLGDRLREGR